jgi:hypothetical protein
MNCRRSQPPPIAVSLMRRLVYPGDSYAIVVAHQLDNGVIIDAIGEIRPPFNAFDVINTMLVPLCKAYRVYKVVGDNYAGELAKESVRRADIVYEFAPKHKSELYADPFLPMLNAKKIVLPRNERAINQICSLERSVQRSGRDQITHPIHGHDDCANAIAGAVDVVRSHSSHDLAHKYRAFQPGFRDEDLPPLPPASQPNATEIGGNRCDVRNQLFQRMDVCTASINRLISLSSPDFSD